LFAKRAKIAMQCPRTDGYPAGCIAIFVPLADRH
jgi:hypothetical protein